MMQIGQMKGGLSMLQNICEVCRAKGGGAQVYSINYLK